MSYTNLPGSGRLLNDIIETSAEKETLDLKSGEFVAKNGKTFKVVFTLAAIISTAVGLLIHFFEGIESNGVEYLFLCIGVLAFLLLPTLLTYRCTINKFSMKEEYFIVFVKVEKEVLWENVKYKRIRKGRNQSITFYNSEKKRLISFDNGLVGYSRILKMAKQRAVKNKR